VVGKPDLMKPSIIYEKCDRFYSIKNTNTTKEMWDGLRMSKLSASCGKIYSTKKRQEKGKSEQQNVIIFHIYSPTTG
jgi:hypothetical protein